MTTAIASPTSAHTSHLDRDPAIISPLEFTDNTDNTVEGYACFDCILTHSTGENVEPDPRWNRAEFYATCEDFFVATSEEVEEFSTRECIMCETNVAGYRQQVTLEPRT